MRHESLRSILLAALSIWPLAAALPLAAATPELDRLAREVADHLASGERGGEKSLRLSAEIGWSRQLAGYEKDAAKRAELLERLAGLRQDLAGSARIAADLADGTGVDKANGTFSGRVSDDGEPLEGAEVRAYAPDGTYWSSALTGADGRYSLSLGAGTYVLYAEPPGDASLSPQLHDGRNCRIYSTCQPWEGDALALPAGGHLTIDFALRDLGRIAGEVRRRDTGEPVATRLLLFRNNGIYQGSQEAGHDGSYAFGGLEPGRYLVVAGSLGELAGMVYDGVPCNAQPFDFEFTCSRELATTVDLSFDEAAGGIDFELIRGASIEGRVTDARTGQPVKGELGQVFTPEFLFVEQAQILPGGTFLVEGLAPGRYLAGVYSPTFTPQVYDRYNCALDFHCIAGARPIDLASGDRATLDFPLDKRGSLAGRVRDDRSGEPVAGATVYVEDRASGASYGFAITDIAGFFSFSNLPAIEMALSARHDDYRGEYFDDVDERRGREAATPIRILPGEVKEIEMQLARRGSLAARVLAAESGQPLQCSFYAFPLDDLAAPAQVYFCDENGEVRVDKLLPGLYYVVAHGNDRARFLHGKGSCNTYADSFSCDLRDGVAVEVKKGEETRLGDIRLERAGRISVATTFVGAGNAPLRRGQVRLFEKSGKEVSSATLFGAQQGALFLELAPGSYRLVADGSPQWQSFAYPAVPCDRWYCDPLRGEEIAVAAGGTVVLEPFRLEPIAPYAGCAAGENALCLNQGRYRVSATWRDFAGATGAGVARGLTADSGYFYFFSPGNLEVLVKALNGCDRRLGHHFWIYAAGLTNVQVELRVVDTLTGAVEIYSNALGETFQPILDNQAFATCDAGQPYAATPAAAAPAMEAAEQEGESCQGVFCPDGRFEVVAQYRTLSGQSGLGTAHRVTPDTLTFSFFDFSNVELVVKVLDACSTALPRYWVFASGLTDVEVELKVRDRTTNQSQTYRQPFGPFLPILDLTSFLCD